MVESNQINVAIQLLPTKTSVDKLELIDKAILLIQQSGLKHIVCPFETVIEGSYEAIFKLVNDIRKQSIENGCEELIINIKIHAGAKDLFFEDKLIKYS
jgi:uncharacterized protein YqgV (UPF0045/DUF77 family)